MTQSHGIAASLYHKEQTKRHEAIQQHVSENEYLYYSIRSW